MITQLMTTCGCILIILEPGKAQIVFMKSQYVKHQRGWTLFFPWRQFLCDIVLFVYRHGGGLFSYGSPRIRIDREENYFFGKKSSETELWLKSPGTQHIVVTTAILCFCTTVPTPKHVLIFSCKDFNPSCWKYLFQNFEGTKFEQGLCFFSCRISCSTGLLQT